MMSISASQDEAPAQSQTVPCAQPAAGDAFLQHKERSN